MKAKGRVLQAAREKRIPHIQGKPREAISGFLGSSYAGQWDDILEMLPTKNTQHSRPSEMKGR